MLSLLDFVFGIAELFLSWRLYVGFAVTAGLCWLLISFLPNETAQWLVCVPLGLVGVFLSFRWQIRADSLQ